MSAFDLMILPLTNLFPISVAFFPSMPIAFVVLVSLVHSSAEITTLNRMASVPVCLHSETVTVYAALFPMYFYECHSLFQSYIYFQGCGMASSRFPPHKQRRIPITNLVQAKHTCKINESVCGIPGREDTFDFECVDTSEALDSCAC
jgi:hypothetical protein